MLCLRLPKILLDFASSIYHYIKETSSIFSSQIFWMRISRCGQNFCEAIHVQKLQSSNFKHESLNILSSQTTKTVFWINIYILFYFLRHCVQDYQKHQRNIVTNFKFFSPQIFEIRISRYGQNFYEATITIFKLQTWIFKYIIFSNH